MIRFEVAFDASIINIKNFSSRKCTNDRPDTISDKGKTNFCFCKAVALLEEGRHSSDAHLPNGIIDGKKDHDWCSVLGSENSQRS